ncbi:hypothetical protein GGR21_001840 [Dysgonomonas hofstadii]|uniref:BIG2 domain-containing protein n=1 Tax=Dysgonomonas hofstadii TaxID=637886 RepID=A0A840CSS0_9BACT|nr:Ig-like domain-containing protein [Dysgonomonas hofstadii]MBB4035945.1 hypothetical protein [Dysgonomonas hofstadii]
MRKINYLLLILFALSFAACDDDDEVSSLTLSSTELTMYSQGTTSILVQGNGGYTASSSDEEIATVSIDGDAVLIKGKKVGKATITVKDKKDKTAEIEVTLYEENYTYKILGSDIFLVRGEVADNILNEIKGDIQQFYPAENGNLYRFVRNNRMEGILTIHPSGSEQVLYKGSFMAGKASYDIMRMDIKENVYYYFAYEDETKEKSAAIGGGSSLPFTFYDKLILVYNCTDYYKEKYPSAGIEYMAFGQYLESVDID